MTIKVENNFLDNEFFWKICKMVTGPNFPWYVGRQPNDLIHNLIYEPNLKKENSFYAPKILDPIIHKLNIKNITSSKLTLNFLSSSIKEISFPQEDIDISNKSFRGFLCMNTNNSEINISGIDKMPLIENRFFSFPKNNTYNISTHTDVRCRIILELIYDLDN